jgi:hypothetical protein
MALRIGQGTLGTTFAAGWSGYTGLCLLNENLADASAPIAGTISHVQVESEGAGTVSIRFIRRSGTSPNRHLAYLGGTGNLTVAAGLNELDITPVSVQIGDFIAIYWNGAIARYGGSGNACWYHNGDITGDTEENVWTLGQISHAVGGDIVPSAPSVTVNNNRVWIIG